jgi:chromosome partitioning protein
MIKIVVHSPKGGVGKTTLATNIAIFLARQGHRVLAYDLAQRGRMTDFLKAKPEFSKTATNEIRTEELGELPVDSVDGGRSFRYLVADTDDYYQILANLLEKNRRGWRAIAPIVWDDQTGLEDIPREIGKLMTEAMLEGGQRPKLFVVANKCPLNSAAEALVAVSKALERHGIRSLLREAWIPKADDTYHPYFIDQPEFSNAISELLESIEV